MLVLEREDRAMARGATRYARIEGYASTCDAYHRVQMDPGGVEIVRCIDTALDRAHRRPEEIGYINYHGTSTQLNDAIESRCVRRVFGHHADSVPGSSTKSHDRAPARCQRRSRRGGGGPRACPRCPASHDQPPRSGPRVRHGLYSKHGPPGRGGRRALQLSRIRVQEQRVGARTRTMRQLEVVVVGAGPAGSVAALVLARAGVEVRLVDRAGFPRDKLCGDTLNPGALSILDRLGIGNRVRERAIPIGGMVVTGTIRRTRGLRLSGRSGRGRHLETRPRRRTPRGCGRGRRRVCPEHAGLRHAARGRGRGGRRDRRGARGSRLSRAGYTGANRHCCRRSAFQAGVRAGFYPICRGAPALGIWRVLHRR